MPTVVIVDDAMFIRTQLKKFFEEELHFEVLALGQDGNDAVKLFHEKSPDLLTLDLTMPNKSGVEAIREIMHEYPEARILVISAIKDASLITESLHLGAKSFLNKPLQLNSPDFIKTFKEEIKEVLN